MREQELREEIENLKIKRFTDRFHHTSLAWLILGLSVVITVMAWFLSDRYVNERIRDRFDYVAQDIVSRIQTRLADQELILRAGVGLIEASNDVSREDWRRFAEQLDLDVNFPGLLGYGFSVVVRPEDLEEHVRSVREEGFPDYRIRPEGERELYTSIIYLEPFDWRNQRAFGYDMYSEPTRREAMQRAIDEGQASVSGRVTLVQETTEDVQHGFLMYLPSYHSAITPDTVEARRRQILGFVYSPFRMKDLMMGILGQQEQGLQFAIYDDIYTQNEHQADQEHQLMYSTVAERELADLEADSLYRKSVRIEFGSRYWDVELYADQAFVSPLDQSQPAMIAATGGVIDILLFLVILSLTRQKQLAVESAEKMSRASIEIASRLQTILDAVDDAIITFDKKGLIESCNPAVTTIFGYAPEQLIGKNVKMLMPESYASRHDGFIRAYLETGEKRIIGSRREVEGLTAEGAEFPLELSVNQLEFDGVQMFLGVVRDLTEEKKVEKLKQEFISTVSHELRTPLTAIKGGIGLMVGGAAGELPTPAADILRIAENNCRRLGVLIDDILDLEKLTSGGIQMNVQPLNVREMVEEAVLSNREYAARYDCEYRISQDEQDVVVHADPVRLQQVLANLLSNAAKFSAGAAVVDVVVSVSAGNERVRIEVRDHGPGVPEEFLPRLFERFSQADSSDTRKVGGSGLGLYISKEMVQRMKGKIGCFNREEGGACFYIEFACEVLPG